MIANWRTRTILCTARCKAEYSFMPFCANGWWSLYTSPISLHCSALASNSSMSFTKWIKLLGCAKPFWKRIISALRSSSRSLPLLCYGWKIQRMCHTSRCVYKSWWSPFGSGLSPYTRHSRNNRIARPKRKNNRNLFIIVYNLSIICLFLSMLG